MKADNRYLVKLAWKNIRRNAGRSFFIGFSVALSVTIAVWVMALFDGMNHQIEGAVVQGNVGYAQLQEKNYSLTTDPMSPAPLSSAQFGALRYSPEIILDGYVTAPEGTAGLQIVGVQPVLHARTFGIDQTMTAGEWLTPGTRGIVIGKETAAKFQLAVGDQLVVNFQDAKAELRTELLPIHGIYSKNGRSFERSFAYVDGDVVEEYLFGEASPELLVHRVAFMGETLPATLLNAQLLAPKTNLVAKSWKDLNPEMAVVLDFHDGMIKFFFIIVGLTVIVTILTPVSMLWQERQGEIRMMSIIGVPPGKIWRMGIFEAGVMGLLAGTASAACLVLVLSWQGRHGISFKDLSDGPSMERAGIELPRVIFPLLQAHHLMIAYAFVLAVVGLSYGWAVFSVQRRVRRSP